MKKIVLAIAINTLFSAMVFGQDSDSTKTIFCQLVGTKVFGKVVVEIDMGESRGFFGLNVSHLLDEKTGAPKKFNGMIDALNYMSEKGWDFVQAYAFHSGGSNVYHYLLQMRVIKNAEGKYYPATKKVFGN
jgi:hypothetical protein